MLLIPKEIVERLTTDIDADVRKLVARLLPNPAWVALETLVRLGRERVSNPESDFTLDDARDVMDRTQAFCSTDPLRARLDLIEKDLCFGDYLIAGLEIASELSLPFVSFETYWLQNCEDLKETRHEKTLAGNRQRPFTHATIVTPTSEQALLIAAAVEGPGSGVLKAEALAGTGKTTLCGFLGEALRQTDRVYIAFNRNMAEEAKRRLGHLMHCRTADSLAYSTIQPWKLWGEHRVRRARLDWLALADALGLPPMFGAFRRGPLVRLIHQTVLNYCNSADQEILRHHLPPVSWPEAGVPQVIEWARALWDRMIDKGQTIPVLPQQVMKWWQLHGGNIPYDAVLFDEAQDASGALVDILQRWYFAFLIAIGDSNQQLYGWRGACDSMLALPGSTYPLTRSWRFGAAIAEFANYVLQHKSRPPIHLVVGNNGISSRIIAYCDQEELPEWPVTILARSNAQVFRAAVDIASQGHRLHVAGDVAELRWLLSDALRLFRGEAGAVTHWRLACFSSWASLESEAQLTNDVELKRIQDLIRTRHDALEHQLEVLAKKHVPDPLKAAAIIATTHKVKGREWDRVMLADDFLSPSDAARLPADKRDAELNVLYVAATRARRELYVPARLLLSP